ncbi:MAG: N-acetyltransferase [Paracoccus sp. (in: a-proteobacteria)]|nr:N-acetyltransferase [Paracoccus sp. (in: a-proteobacteria)]
MDIRPERPGDKAAIAALTTAAFLTAPHSDGTEADIIARLRAAGALSLSLVAVDGARIIGHAAFSPVTIAGGDQGWMGLGPVSVRPARQGRGTGAALIRDGLARIGAAGAGGCVVLGDPGYYQRFGFAALPGLTLPGLPAGYFMALPFKAPPPQGEVAYHPAFAG